MFCSLDEMNLTTLHGGSLNEFSDKIKHEFKLPSLLSPYTCFWERSIEHVRCWFKKKIVFSEILLLPGGGTRGRGEKNE